MARRSADFLGCLFGVSMLCHGMFFLREWLIIGFLTFAGAGWLLWHKYRPYGRLWLEKVKGQTFKVNCSMITTHLATRKTLWLWPFLGMAFLSLLGLLRPVIPYLAWFEVWRWLLYACLFWWSREVARQGQWPRLRAWMLTWGVLLVVSGFVPGLTVIWPQAVTEVNRWGSWIGYPNMAGAMAGALFFLALPTDSKGTDAQTQVKLMPLRRLAPLSRLLPLSRLAPLMPFLPLVFLAALWASGSRGVLVCWLTVMVFWICLKRKRCGLPLFALLAVLTGVMGIYLAKIFGIMGEEWTRFLTWDAASLAERCYYLRDALGLAALNYFWPSAGSWHAYPLVADSVYRSSDPHSAILSILLNQGGVGVLFVLLWGAGRLRMIVIRRGKGLGLCPQNWPIVAGLCFLAFHGLMDADMAFGCWGFVFWIFAGVVSFSASSEYHIEDAFR